MLNVFDFSVLVSKIGDTESVFIATIIIGALLFVFKRHKESILLVLSSFLAIVTTYTLKNLLKIPRPEDMLVIETSYRFPSGHSTMAGVAVGFYFFVLFKQIRSRFWKVFFGVLVLAWYAAINFARLYLNVHVFIDVFIGGVIGLVAVHLSVYVYNRYRRSR